MPEDEDGQQVEQEQAAEAVAETAVAMPSPNAENPMREMVEYVAKTLASNPDAVSVTEEQEDGRIVLRLTVDEKDKGKVIGRDGRVAQSLRSLLRVAAVKAGTRVNLEIE